jgi:hypothetical protein
MRRKKNMCLETLKDVKEIGGFSISRAYGDCRPDGFIEIDDLLNVVVFRLQNGPIKEVGVNGCQVDTLIEAAKLIIEGLNKNYPCRENAVAITKLDEALMWLEKRKKDREKRGVEGHNAV